MKCFGFVTKRNSYSEDLHPVLMTTTLPVARYSACLLLLLYFYNVTLLPVQTVLFGLSNNDNLFIARQTLRYSMLLYPCMQGKYKAHYKASV